jgi:hypothetical protein
LDTALRQVFGWDAVRVDRHEEPGQRSQPLVVLRAAIPAA